MVLTMEAPTVLRWLRGGELLLTSGFAFKNNLKFGTKLILDLASINAAGLGIKPGHFLAKTPQAMIDCAEEVGLPLIEIPTDMPYSEIISPIFEAIINEQYSQLKKAKEVHEKFYDLLLKGGTLTSISHLLSILIDNPVFIVDGSGNLRGKGVPKKEDQPTFSIIQNYCQKNAVKFGYSKNVFTFKIPVNQTHYSAIAFRIETAEKNNDFLIVVQYYRPLAAQCEIAIKQATAMAALEFRKEKAVFEAEHRFGSGLVEEIIFDNFENIDNIRRQASFLNFNLDKINLIFVIQAFPHILLEEKKCSFEDSYKLLKIVNSVFNDYPGGALFSQLTNKTIALVNDEGITLLEKYLNHLNKKLANAFSAQYKFFVGVGRKQTDITKLKTSYQQALLSSRIGEKLNKNIVFHNQLGILELLFEFRNSPQLKMFFQRYLSPIFNYDSKNNSDLLKTLEAYLDNNGNLDQTAANLFIHKNTVRYRLRKIQELTDLNLKSTEDFLTLQVAIKSKTIFDNRF